MLPTKTIECPYCGEPIELIIDDSEPRQQYVEDCSVCCRPIHLSIQADSESDIVVDCRTDSET